MRIGFGTSGKLTALQKSGKLEKIDLFCLSFGGLEEVNYEKEVRGEQNEMEEVALFSHNFDCVVVAGCYTDTRGIKRKSAIVADKGKILGVSDGTTGLDGEKYRVGSGVRVYDTSAGRIGVLVGRDIYFSGLIKSLSQCGSDIVVCAYEHLGQNFEQVLIRADAFRYGVTVCLFAHGFAEVAEPNGEISFASPFSPVYCDVKNHREYHLVEMRRKGFYLPQKMY